MCDVATAAVAVTAASQLAQGYSKKQAYEAQAEVARYNAVQAQNEATRTRNLGVQKENQLRQKTAALLSTQKARFGASGVRLDSGSPLQVMEDTQSMGEVDAQRVRQTYLDQAQASDDQASLLRAQASDYESAGSRAIFGSVLGAAASAGTAAVSSGWFDEDSAGSLLTGSPSSSFTV